MQPAAAGTPDWVGNLSSDWFTAGNWNPSGTPNAGDTVTIDKTSPNATVINGATAAALATSVGASATGNLTIGNGGSLTDTTGGLGLSAGSSGTVTVTGAGSTWTNIGDLSVGRAGTGTLQILAGGNVSAVNASIGDLTAGASGSVTVSGSGSAFSTSNLLFVGDHGSGALTVSGGGHVTSSAGATVGSATTATGTATIDGAGSTWTVSNFLVVGQSGQGAMTVSNGGAITSIASIVGYFSSGTVTVSGAGSSWVNSGPIGVGYSSGGHGTLVISNGTTVTSTVGTVLLGVQSGSTGALFIGSKFATAPTAPGTLNASLVQFGAGIGSAIVFNHTSINYVFAPQIAGAGPVNQAAGYTELSANNTYTGTTQISGGTLAVTGSIASSSGVLVQTGGTLAGTGTVASTFVADGILSAGIKGAGSLAVQGSLVLQSAATYLVQINGGNSTSTSVTATAQIDGTVSVVPVGRVNAKTTYTILNASGGISGTFASLAFNNTGLARNPQLTYTANTVLLTLDSGLLSPVLSAGANINQRNVAAGIDNALAAGAVPSNGFNTLLGLTGSNLNNALTQASGEAATGAQQSTFNAMSQFINVMLDPFIGSRANAGAQGDGDALSFAEGGERRAKAGRDAFASMSTKAPIASVPRWNVWAAGYGGSQSTDGNAVVGSNAATSRIAGTAVGADYLLSPNTIAGFALGGGGTSFSTANGLGGGRSDLFHAGAYARHTMGNAYVAGALAYGWQDVTTDRTVTIAGFDQLQARFNANAWSGRLEGGNRYATPWMGITPYAAAQFTTLLLPGYGEQARSGASTFALTYAGKDVTASRTELGLRADSSYAVETAILTLRGRAAWAHDYNADRTIAATFQTLPGASFVVNGAAQAHDAALATASAEMRWLNGWSAAATFEGEFSTVTRSYAGKGAVRYQW